MAAIAAETKTAFDEIDATVDEFERVLDAHGIKVRPGSQLEHALLFLKDLKSRRADLIAGRGWREWKDPQEDLRLGLGTFNVVQLVLRHRNHPDFNQLLPHLALLNEGIPAQTTRITIVDDASNKIFELRLALACLSEGRHLLMDHPVRSSGGNNPDVLSEMNDGRKWGFPCKVLYSESPITLVERLREGVAQIERSPAGSRCRELQKHPSSRPLPTDHWQG